MSAAEEQWGQKEKKNIGVNKHLRQEQKESGEQRNWPSRTRRSIKTGREQKPTRKKKIAHLLIIRLRRKGKKGAAELGK